MIKAFVLLATLALGFSAPLDLQQDSEWELFKTTHKKTYDQNTEGFRKQVFLANLRIIQKHNIEADLGMHTFWMGVNEFSDQTNLEFRKYANGYRMAANRTSGSTYLPASNTNIPETVDWRTKGYVTPVKNQGQCGSCWAFSTTGSLEGQHFKKYGKLVSLSEQQLVDCSGSYGNNGCEGGLMDNAFKYIKDNGGIDTEACYPYEARDATCRFQRSCVAATDTGFVDIQRGNEDKLKSAVAENGPISVAIDAGHQSFQTYRSGIYDEPQCSSTRLDHGVLVVGYGTDNGQDYWLVKNSWGPSWGMEGYLKMSRNKNNQCGIATQASFPLV
ncbi:procathepsin L-like [Lineus longissimus]|uniref:procathepsin L-like n=1 Tax=Lineus longissimus TaxID=88925 RepID=UPI002B4C9A76